MITGEHQHVALETDLMELEKFEKAGRVTGDFVSSGRCLSASL